MQNIKITAGKRRLALLLTVIMLFSLWIVLPREGNAADEAPNISVNYTNGQLQGFVTSNKYQIRAAGTISFTTFSIQSVTTYNIPGEWMMSGAIVEVQLMSGESVTGTTKQVTLKARPAAPAGVTSVPETYDGINNGKITAVDSTMEYRKSDNDGTYTSVGNATEITGIPVGFYYVRYKATNDDFASAITEINLRKRLPPPELDINYYTEEITGFIQGANYYFNLIYGQGTSFGMGDFPGTTWPIGETWFGTIIPIGRNGDGVNAGSNTNCNLNIPARPTAPTTPAGVTGSSSSDGKITGVTADMEYKLSTESWGTRPAINGTEVTGLAPGIYNVRSKATNAAFASPSKNIFIVPSFTLSYSEGGVTLGADADDPATKPFKKSTALAMNINLTSPIGYATERYFTASPNVAEAKWVLNPGTTGATLVRVATNSVYNVRFPVGATGTATLTVDGVYTITFTVTNGVVGSNNVKVGETFAADGYEWRVLMKNSTENLIIAEHITKNVEYNNVASYPPWINSEIRNTTLIPLLNTLGALNSRVQTKTLWTMSKAYGITGTASGSYEDTQDNIFLLSLEEIFYTGQMDNETVAESATVGTANLRTNGSTVIFADIHARKSNGPNDWWLRSPSFRSDLYNGSVIIYMYGNLNGRVVTTLLGLRPALWLDLSSPLPPSYPLTVNGGSGTGWYLANTQISITADVLAGQEFSNWAKIGDGSFQSDTTSPTNFTMPASSVTVTAQYRWAKPTATINYSAEKLEGLVAGEKYTFVTSGADVTLEAGVTTYDIPAGWMTSGQALSIVRKASGGKADSLSQTNLTVPARRAAPSVGHEDETGAGLSNGKITGLTASSTDYEIKPSGSAYTSATVTASGEIVGLAADSYEVRLKATSSNFASVAASVTILADANDISGAEVTLSQTSYTYDGNAKTPTPTVKLGGDTLTLNTNYTVGYTNNTNAGTATVTITGTGSYANTVTKNFTIGKASISPAVSMADWTYGGTPSTPSVSGNTGSGTESFTYSATENETYNLPQPTGAGTYWVKASIAASADGNYESGEAKASFTIDKVSITFTGTVTATKVYDGGGTFSNEQITIENATSFSGTIPGDVITLDKTGVTGSLVNPNVTESPQTLTVSGVFALTGEKEGNYTLTQPPVSASITKANGTFGTPGAIDTTYVSGLKLSDLTLSAGYAWKKPDTALTVANDGQQFDAIFTDTDGNHKPADGKIVVNVAKAAGAAVDNAPTASGITHTSVTLNAVTISGENPGVQMVEYAVSTESTAPGSGWQDELVFDGLDPNTPYYFFARAKANDNYLAGAASTGTQITTNRTPVVNEGSSDKTATYDPEGIDLASISGLFTFGTGAGAKTYTVEASGNPTGEGTINSDSTVLNVTKSGTFTIGLVTAADGDYAAGAKVTATLTVNKAKISAVSVTVTAPVKGQTPATTATTNPADTTYQVGSGGVAWSPEVANKFLGGTAYTAEILLEIKDTDNYIWDASVPATVAGSSGAEFDPDSGKLTVTYPTLGAKTLTGLTKKGGPTKGLDGYTHGDTLNLSGLVLTAAYDDGTTADITSWTNVVFKIDGSVVTSGTTEISRTTHNSETLTAYYTENGVEKDAEVGELTVAKAEISNVAVQITAPVTGAAPATSATSIAADSYPGGTVTGTVAWNPNDTPFKGNTQYTVTITLQVADQDNYKWADAAAVTINSQAATSFEKTTGAATYAFAQLSDATLTGLTVKTNPTNDLDTYTYTHGDALDLTGLVLEAAYNDSSTVEISGDAWSGVQFKIDGVNVASDVTLSYTDHNGEKLTAEYGGQSVEIGELTVAKKNIADATVTVASGTYVYKGEAWEPGVASVALLGGGTLESGTDYEAITSNDYTSNVNVGTNAASVTVTGKGNYTGTASGNFSIAPKELTVGDIAFNDKDYDGTTDATPKTPAPSLVGIVNSEDVILDGSDVSYAFTSKNAGTTTVNRTGDYKLSGTQTANYTLTQPEETFTASIGKATPNITWPTAAGITYGAALSTSTLSGGSATDGSGNNKFAWTNSTTVPTVQNSGCEVTFTPTDTANYEYTGVTLTKTTVIAVSKATPGITLTFNPESGSAYGTPVTLTATLTGSGSGLTPSGTVTFYNGNELIGAAQDLSLGTASVTTAAALGVSESPYTLKAVYSGNDNYLAPEKSESYTVIKAANNGFSVSQADITYPAQPNPTPNGERGDVTYEYKIQDADDNTYASDAPTNAGSYTVRATDDGGTNYNSATDMDDFTINKATIPSVAVSVTAPVKGATPATTATTVPEDTTYTADGITWTPAVVDKFLGGMAYTAEMTITIKDTVNYEWADDIADNASVNSADATSFTPNDGKLTYAFDTLGNKVVKEITVKGAGPTKALSSYTHGDTLDLADLEFTVTYDDESDPLTITSPWDGVDFKIDGGTVTSGTTTISYTDHNGKKLAAEYGGKSVEIGELTVAKKNISGATVTVTPGTYTYKGSAWEPGVSSVTLPGGVTLQSGTDYETITSGSYTDNVNAGDATVTITGTGNYTDTATGNFTISKAALVITWPTAADITYGAALSTSALSGGSATDGSGNGNFAWTDGITVPTVQNSGYSVTFTPTDTANYAYDPNDLTETVQVNVNPADGSFGSHATISATYTPTLKLSDLNNELTAGYTWKKSGTELTVAQSGNGFDAIFTDPDGNHKPADGTITVNIAKATPTVTTWPTAADIDKGQALSSSTLDNSDAEASVPGSFAWTDESLKPETSGSYSVTFTPDDNANYSSVTGDVHLTVMNPTPPPPPPAQIYIVTVINGAGSGLYEAGVPVSITADEPQAGQTFDIWTSNDGADFTDAGSAQTSFIMPANNVTVTATYKDAQEAASDIISFTVTGAAGVISGTNIRVTVPAGTDVTALAPTIIVSEGASVSPASGAAQDFTAPVTYTVTAKNGNTKDYTVTVTDGPQAAPGWVHDNDAWYLFDENEQMLTGWQWVDGKWYYLDEATGIMLTGWVYDDTSWYYLAGSGAMKTGWLHDNGSWYYLTGSGAMKTNSWLRYNDVWYYLREDGVMDTGWLYDDNYEAWFYLTGNGTMEIGWLYDNDRWYYFIGNGAMKVGWLYDDPRWYYFTGDGAMQTSSWVNYKDNWYYLRENGVMAENNWIAYKNNRYYLRPVSGTMPESKWLRYGGSMYYLKAGGARAVSESLRMDGKYYQFNSAGKLLRISPALRGVSAR